MSQSQRIPLAQAQRIADRIRDELQKFCTRIEIAGSIRRQQPDVGDIDLVCEVRPALENAFLARVLQSKPVIHTNGAQVIEVTLRNGVRLDIWLATVPTPGLFEDGAGDPSNFGSLLICRTGSVEFNIALIEHAKRLGLRWHPHNGVSPLVPSVPSVTFSADTEEAVFKALQLPFIAPEQREPGRFGMSLLERFKPAPRMAVH